jgi:hypothetical protein
VGAFTSSTETLGACKDVQDLGCWLEVFVCLCLDGRDGPELTNMLLKSTHSNLAQYNHHHCKTFHYSAIIPQPNNLTEETINKSSPSLKKGLSFSIVKLVLGSLVLARPSRSSP